MNQSFIDRDNKFIKVALAIEGANHWHSDTTEGNSWDAQFCESFKVGRSIDNVIAF